MKVFLDMKWPFGGMHKSIARSIAALRHFGLKTTTTMHMRYKGIRVRGNFNSIAFQSQGWFSTPVSMNAVNSLNGGTGTGMVVIMEKCPKKMAIA